jgi:homoserine kinase type II
MSTPLVASLLSQFAGLGAIRRIQPLASGFSGSELWKVTAESGEYGLRRWPEGTTTQRLVFIHSFQRRLRDSGLNFVPVPATASGDQTSVLRDGRLWELCSWMPGQADFRQHPSPARLAAAMRALARIHQAAAQIPGQTSLGRSPGIAARLAQLQQLLASGMERIEASVARQRRDWDHLAQRICQRFRDLSPRVEPQLAAAATISGPLFPCLRDIWHDHVLFTGDDVTGIIDFGAARTESPAGDVARLVGSLVGDHAEGWRAALAMYAGVASPLAADLYQLIRAFDASGVLLSGINWLNWLYVEERQFDDAAAVMRRMNEIVLRLDHSPLPPLR